MSTSEGCSDIAYLLPLTSKLLKPTTWSATDETAAADQLATVHPKWRGCSDNQLAVDLGRHPPSS